MAAYYVVLVHFPIALWMTATLSILLRAFSDGELAQAVDRALVPLLTVALISGLQINGGFDMMSSSPTPAWNSPRTPACISPTGSPRPAASWPPTL